MKLRGFSDIAYNFLIGGDGLAYECRGWDKAGAHTLRMNDRSIGISFIGSYTNKVPGRKMISSFWKLIDLGVEDKKLSPNFIVFTHRQIRNSLSPGTAFYEMIKTWPQWREYDTKKDIPPYTHFIQQNKLSDFNTTNE